MNSNNGQKSNINSETFLLMNFVPLGLEKELYQKWFWTIKNFLSKWTVYVAVFGVSRATVSLGILQINFHNVHRIQCLLKEINNKMC